jgi:hypothetical protein
MDYDHLAADSSPRQAHVARSAPPLSEKIMTSPDKGRQNRTDRGRAKQAAGEYSISTPPLSRRLPQAGFRRYWLGWSGVWLYRAEPYENGMSPGFISSLLSTKSLARMRYKSAGRLAGWPLAFWGQAEAAPIVLTFSSFPFRPMPERRGNLSELTLNLLGSQMTLNQWVPGSQSTKTRRGRRNCGKGYFRPVFRDRAGGSCVSAHRSRLS